jgi:hypothetical protein
MFPIFFPDNVQSGKGQVACSAKMALDFEKFVDTEAGRTKCFARDGKKLIDQLCCQLNYSRTKNWRPTF